MEEMELRVQFYGLVVSQLLHDNHCSVAATIRRKEKCEAKCLPSDRLFQLVKSHIENNPSEFQASTESVTDIFSGVDEVKNATQSELRHVPPTTGTKTRRRTTGSTHHSTKSSCNGCQETFEDSFSFYKHLEEIHMTSMETGCVCKLCNKLLKDKYTLNNHLKTHSLAKTILCPCCGEGFKRTTDYNDHKQKYHESNSFTCPHCDKTYSLIRSLQKHVAEVHRNPGRHVCSLCGKQFNSSNQLKMHERVHHTREKPYQCKECDRTFRGLGHLHNHMLLHVGIKEFKCGLCAHRVYQKGNMKSHMKIHTGTKNIGVFWCSGCKQAWPSQSEVDTHSTGCGSKQSTTTTNLQQTEIKAAVNQPKSSQAKGNASFLTQSRKEPEGVLRDSSIESEILDRKRRKLETAHPAGQQSEESTTSVFGKLQLLDVQEFSTSDAKAKEQRGDKNLWDSNAKTPASSETSNKEDEIHLTMSPVSTSTDLSISQKFCLGINFKGKVVEILVENEPNVEEVKQLVQQLMQTGTL